MPPSASSPLLSRAMKNGSDDATPTTKRFYLNEPARARKSSGDAGVVRRPNERLYRGRRDTADALRKINLIHMHQVF
jgi:hypothetical protein